MLSAHYDLPRALFITKLRHEYSATPPAEGYAKELTSGLYNSAQFVANMLMRSGIEAETVAVVDNNSIEREVVRFKPTHVFVEALWVVPEKIELLAKMYPRIIWVVRIHSNTPFLANEGVAMAWLKGYYKIATPNVVVAPNSPNLVGDLMALPESEGKTELLPNFYEFTSERVSKAVSETEVHIGCFGAVRPLKNQLIQAMAAMRFANKIGKTLFFHINSGRVEQRGNNVLKNLQALFVDSGHVLVEHGWLVRKDFLALIRQMDVCLQVSLTETFNITAADSVNELVPIVAGKDINWLQSAAHADTSSSDDILAKLMDIYEGGKLSMVKRNWLDLHRSNIQAMGKWLNFLLK
jgi:hypothetical protein